MQWPLITIIITAYNYAHTLAEAIESALAQDYPCLEILIVDNASTDMTPAVVHPYLDDPRVRYVRNAETLTAAQNHILGLKEARGEYINYLSADDQLIRGYISRAYLFLRQHPEIDLVYSGVYRVDLQGQIWDRRMDYNETPCGYIEGRNAFASLLALGCYIPHATILTHRSTYEQRGNWSTEHTAKDYDMYIRWAKSGVRIARLDGCGVLYRIHRDSISSVENYGLTGKELDEFCSHVQRHIDQTNAHRVRGYESSILEGIASRNWRVKSLEHLDQKAIAEKVQAAATHVENIRAFNNAQPFEPKIAVIIIHRGNQLTDLQRTVNALLQQVHQDWEALIIEQGGIDLKGFCEKLDPQGRVRSFHWQVPVSQGRGLNLALSLTSANCFVVLESGNALSPEHLRCAVDSFRTQPYTVLVANGRVILHDAVGNHASFSDVFAPATQLNAVAFAPVFPLDLITFRREAYDMFGKFHDAAPAEPHWPLLINTFNAAPVGLTNLTVDLYTPIETPSITERIDRQLQAAGYVYERARTGNPDLLQKRSAYVGALQQLRDDTTLLQPSAENKLRFLTALYGTAVASDRREAAIA